MLLSFTRGCFRILCVAKGALFLLLMVPVLVERVGHLAALLLTDLETRVICVDVTFAKCDV